MHQGSVGTCAPHVGHSTYLYPAFNLHISYFSWNYFVCVSGRSQQPEPSGPSRKVPDLPDLLLSQNIWPQICMQASITALHNLPKLLWMSKLYLFVCQFVCLTESEAVCFFNGSQCVIVKGLPVFVWCVFSSAYFSYLLKTIPYLARSHTPLLIASFHPPLTRAFSHACSGPLSSTGGSGPVQSLR